MFTTDSKISCKFLGFALASEKKPRAGQMVGYYDRYNRKSVRFYWEVGDSGKFWDGHHKKVSDKIKCRSHYRRMENAIKWHPKYHGFPAEDWKLRVLILWTETTKLISKTETITFL